MKEAGDMKATERRLLCCYGQRMTDERRPEIKRSGIFLERKKVRGLAMKSCTKECR